uniref:Ig-like domain-containing protein n=1 Tax=Leptobrachium leishanense TaxID=445787 RepID=A0A8C5QCS0_9ANUR
MCLTQGLLTWTLILAALTAPASSLSLVNGTDGGSVYLSGKLPLPATWQVTWEFHTTLIVLTDETGNTIYMSPYYEGRCELYPNTTLRLDNLTMADQGVYTMTVRNLANGNVVTEQTELRVYRHLTTPTLSSNDSRPVSGSEVNLHCDDDNQTVTSYTFYRNQQDVCSQTHVNCTGPYLIFQPIMEGDAGSYTCTIQNPISNSSSSNAVDLTVSVRVSAVKIQNNTNSILWVGRDSVSLNCSALGTDVQFSWNLNGEKLPSNPRYSLQQNDSLLIIHPVDRSDDGSFTCNASNWLNTNTSESLKLNLGLPVSEVKIQSNTSSSVILWAGNDSVSLSCSADGSALHFSWNLNGVPLPSDSRYQYNQDNSTIIISPLDKKDNGTFTCTATNVLNSETSSDLKLNLYWHPDGDIQCSANGTGQTVNLFCSWPGGLPPANINLTFQSHNQTGQDQVMHSVTLSTITSNDELFCHGAQGGQEKNCTLPLQKPDAEGFTNHSSIPVKIGEKATMTVTLSGSAVGVNSRVLSPKILPATFAWYHYKPEASEVSGGNIVSTELSSTLTLNSVTANENGTYECRATNLFGTTSFFFILDVTEEPVSKGLGAGEIAGIVLGVLAGLAIIGIIIFFILKSKKKKAKAQNFGINSAENPIGIPEYAVINKKNGGMAETSLTNNPQDDKDDVKYAVIKFQNQEQTKPPNSEPEVEYSTVKNASRK